MESIRKARRYEVLVAALFASMLVYVVQLETSIVNRLVIMVYVITLFYLLYKGLVEPIVKHADREISMLKLLAKSTLDRLDQEDALAVRTVVVHMTHDLSVSRRLIKGLRPGICCVLAETTQQYLDRTQPLKNLRQENLRELHEALMRRVESTL